MFDDELWICDGLAVGVGDPWTFSLWSDKIFKIGNVIDFVHPQKSLHLDRVRRRTGTRACPWKLVQNDHGIAGNFLNPVLVLRSNPYFIHLEPRFAVCSWMDQTTLYRDISSLSLFSSAQALTRANTILFYYRYYLYWLCVWIIKWLLIVQWKWNIQRFLMVYINDVRGV